jgi:hypothetical protein
MMGQFLELREQALTLLKIEREQILESFKREKMRSGEKRKHIAKVRPLLILNRSCRPEGDTSYPQ